MRHNVSGRSKTLEADLDVAAGGAFERLADAVLGELADADDDVDLQRLDDLGQRRVAQRRQRQPLARLNISRTNKQHESLLGELMLNHFLE